MSTIVYTKKQLIQRVRKHVSNSRQLKDEFSASDNEILLLIDSVLAIILIGQVYAGAKVEGNLATPEAYLTTYKLPSLQLDISGYWYSTLPQTPVSLPLGYSLDWIYFIDPSIGISKSVFIIKAKRVAYRDNLPTPTGARAWIENNKIILTASDNQSLLNIDLYVRMAKTRTDDISENMNLPDDSIDGIFSKVVQILLQRYGVPQDVVSDDLPAGNKSS